MGNDLDNIICYIYLSYLVNFYVWPGNDPRATSWCKMVADHTGKGKRKMAGLFFCYHLGPSCSESRCLDKQSLR